MALRSTSVLALMFAACSGQPAQPLVSQTGTAARSSPAAVRSSAPLMQLAESQRAQGEIAPPWSLTASDGSGLMLTRVDARAVYEGPLAFTELHLWFHNSEDRRREGTFQITLPEHAQVTRFAMENDGQYMEAEVVEKQLARRAYDDFLHRRQDPALLEKAEGNQFTAKVFPIPAKGDKHIIISFSQELPGTRYVLPLRGLPKIERLDVSMADTLPDGKQVAETLSRRNWQPDRDFVSERTEAAAAVGAGQLVVAQLAPFTGQTTGTDKPAGITLLVDTSASRALGYVRYVQAIHELVAQLRKQYGDALRLDVVAFDQDSERVFRGAAKDFGDAEDGKLLARGAAGASDLGQALDALDAPESRVVIVGDGVMTAGADRAGLEAAIKGLSAKKVERVDIALAGGLRDDELAGALVHAGLARAGAVLDLDGGATEVATALGEPVMTDVPVEIAGADWVYPRTIPTVRAGTLAMVYARLGKPAQTLDVTIGGQHQQIAVLAGPQPLVDHAVAAAEIGELEQQLPAAKPDAAKALRADIAKRAVAARVVSSETSMLVLESDADYARYGIDRKALADVLAIGPTGDLERTHRTEIATSAPPAPTRHMADGDYRVPKTKMKVLETEDYKDAEKGDKQLAEDDVVAGKKEAEEKPEPAKPEPPGTLGSTDDVPAPTAQPALAPPPPPAPPHGSVHVASPGYRAADQTISAGEAQGIAISGAAPAEPDDGSRAPWPPADKPAALTGELATIEHALQAHDVDAALAKARAWHEREPGDVRALIGLGDALEAKSDFATAARMYGSIIDLFPGRADMRRFAGERLARVTAHFGQVTPLVVDTYRRAVEDRPDHLTGHRLLAYALLRSGKPADAFAAILAGVDQPYPEGRFLGGDRVLADDAGMIGAAYAAAEPGKLAEIKTELTKRHLHLATRASTRFILYWETDGNDVDFHIQDARGNHAWYSHKQLASGGELYADITTGYGPECFAIQGKPTAAPYHLSIDYYSQGPMGYGMGLLEIQRFDGKGKLTFEDRPYVIMNDHAFVDLGTWK
jgi:hypothetical protein